MLVASAIIKDGVIYTGHRHHNIIWEHPKQFFNGCVQGFVTDTGEFVDRVEGARLVIECGQIKKLKWGLQLYSEDLW
jgi:hypothetical protein